MAFYAAQKAVTPMLQWMWKYCLSCHSRRPDIVVIRLVLTLNLYETPLTAHTTGTNMSSKISIEIKCYITHIRTKSSNTAQRFHILTAHIVTEWKWYQAGIRMLRSECSRGSSRCNSRADNRLRARQMDSSPNITLPGSRFTMASGEEHMLANQKQRSI